jgi:RND superfamily putative drug exporter
LAQYRVFQQVGPAVAVALTVTMLAALTLVPALASVMGKSLFWPVRPAALSEGKVWPRVARLVTRRPGLTLIVAGLALALPASACLNINWVYDTMADLKGTYPAARGAAMIQRHWPVGELAPVTVVVEGGGKANFGTLTKLSEAITTELEATSGVSEVRSLTAPVGRQTPADQNFFMRAAATTFYASENMQSTRLSVVLDSPAFSNKAMQTLSRVEDAVVAAVAESSSPAAKVYFAGATAEMADIRSLTQNDFYRVSIASLTVISLIVILLLRDVVLAGFLVASTILGYLAALGLTSLVFTGFLGAAGIDWKVEVFLFVVMVAVGQDYNIFLTARLAQEAVGHTARRAAERAIVATGGIISSCGLIMAATLGSLMAGDLQLLVQLGFAFAAGMLIDTFIVRPLVVPAFVVLTGRTGRSILRHGVAETATQADDFTRASPPTTALAEVDSDRGN